MRHQGEHFDVELSRGNFWGFKIKINFLKIKCTNRYNFAATIPGEAG